MPHARTSNMRQVGDRIDLLLNEIRAVADDQTREKAEELVGLLVELYGKGLERIVEIVAADEASGPETIGRLADDDLVASLLVLHGLHPVDLETRVQRALDKVRPYLGSHAGGVDYLGVDEAGIVQLRLEGSCHGCPSSTITVKLAIEGAIMAAAPEVTGIAVEGVAERPAGKVISLDSLRRNGDAAANGLASPNGDHDPGTGQWTAVEGLGRLRSGELAAVEVEGLAIVVLRLGADLVAYRNACAGCGAAWEAGGTSLDGDTLACPVCAARYDVRLAGRSPDRPELHLDALPLLADDAGVRIAVAEVAAR